MKQNDSTGQNLDEASCIYGAGVLLKFCQSLSGEVDGVREGSADIEFIHRARVASRRLRTAMPLFQSCLPAKKAKNWTKEIRNVTRALGAARDADVQIERLEKFYKKQEDTRCRPGLQRLLLRLRQKRQQLQAPVAEAMDHLAKSGVLGEMQDRLVPLAGRASEVYLFTPVLYRHSFNAVHSRLEAFLGFEPIISQPEKVQELHEMRIAAKWLRYSIETFAPLYASNLEQPLQAIKSAQETLGDIHDCDVWTEFLPQFLEEENRRMDDYYGHTRYYHRLVPGIHAFLTDRRQARETSYLAFLSDWEVWKGEEVWDQLHNTIQIPYLKADQVYPPIRR